MQNQQFIALVLGAAVAITGGGVWAKEGETRAEIFQQIDSNSDGAITKTEMEAARAARMARIDTDGDGFLTAEELIAMDRERSEQRVERMLGHLDADKDGKLSEAELKQRQSRRGGFERMDADGDGVVSADEFAEARAHRGKRHGRAKATD